MTETQVRTRYFVKVRQPLTHANLATWLNEGGDSADTLATITLGIGTQAIGEVLEISEDRVKQLMLSEHKDKVYVFMKHPSGTVRSHPCFPAWS